MREENLSFNNNYIILGTVHFNNKLAKKNMSVLKHWPPVRCRWYNRVLIVHQQRYRPSESNKNVDIKFSAHDPFLE